MEEINLQFPKYISEPFREEKTQKYTDQSWFLHTRS